MVQHIRGDLERLGVDTPMLRPEQIAHYLQLTPEEVATLINAGVFSAYQFGPHLRIHLEQFLEEMRVLLGQARVVEQGAPALKAEAPPAVEMTEAPPALPAPAPRAEPAVSEPVPEDEPPRLYKPDGPLLYPSSVKRSGRQLKIPVIKTHPGPDYVLGTEDLAAKLGVSYATLLEWFTKGEHGKIGRFDLFPGDAAEWVYAETGRARNTYAIKKDVVETFLEEWQANPTPTSYAGKQKHQQAPADPPVPKPTAPVAEPKLTQAPKLTPLKKPQPLPAPGKMEEAFTQALDRSLALDPEDAEEAAKLPGMVGLEIQGKNAAMRWTGLGEKTFDREVENGNIHPYKKMVNYNIIPCYSRLELDRIRRQLHPKYAERQVPDVVERRASRA